jgi:hypothetical protein
MAAFSSYPSPNVKLAVVVGVGQCLMTVATNENTGSFFADAGGAVGICTQLIVGKVERDGNVLIALKRNNCR